MVVGANQHFLWLTTHGNGTNKVHRVQIDDGDLVQRWQGNQEEIRVKGRRAAKAYRWQLDRTQDLILCRADDGDLGLSLIGRENIAVIPGDGNVLDLA